MTCCQDQFDFYASLIPESDRAELRRRWEALTANGWTSLGLLEGWENKGDGHEPLAPTLNDLFGVPPDSFYARFAHEPDWFNAGFLVGEG